MFFIRQICTQRLIMFFIGYLEYLLYFHFSLEAEVEMIDNLLVMIKLQLILAIALLLCLAPMPYGYYTLVRYGSAIILGIMALQYYREKKENLAIAWGALAVLFQPIIKMPLGRTMWNIIDVVVALVLLALAWHTYNKCKK